MNNHPLLAENDAKRLNIRLPLLVCFALYSTWQMGVMFFSGEALSISGKTPLPVSIGNMTMLITVAYILSIIFLIFFQQYCILAARVAVSAALLSVLALYIPFSREILALLYYFQAFCCVFIIGLVIASCANLLTEKAEIKNVLVIAIVSGCLIAVLHNDIIPVSFDIFRTFTVAALAFMLFLFCKLPSKIWPHYVKKTDGLVIPIPLFTGLFILICLSNLMTLFGSAVAETTKNGISVYNMAFAVSGVILAVLWKRWNIMPLQSVSVLVALAALGFVLAIASLYITELAIIACALLGIGLTLGTMSTYFGLVMAKRYPSKFIIPIAISTALMTVIIHSALLEAFRYDHQILYIIYVVIAVATAILYLMLEPYLLYSFKNRSLTENSNPQADEQLKDINEQTEENLKQLIGEFPKNLQTSTLDDLSYQELRIAELSLKGHTYAEIATALNLKLNTVRWYMKNIYTKLQINSKAELFHLALKREVKSE